MAKINPVKVKQDAEREEKAGRLDKAILLYRQILDDNPKDWNTINKIGDIYARMNRAREASGEYAKVADFYAKDGFLLKAIAIWKKINKLDATALEPYLNLAELYSKQGLLMEAKGQFQIVVDEYIKRGKMRDAGDVLKKMADIDPADLKIRSKLADLYTRDGNIPKAIEEHVAIADELNKKGHLAEALQVLEKGLKLDAKSNRLRLELARIHLVQKNWDKATSFLEDAIHLAPTDTQLLSKLGEAYLGGRKLEEAEAIFKRLLEIDPKDEETRVQMGRVFVMQGQFDRAHDEFVPLVDRLVERKEGEKAAALLQHIVQKNPSHVKTLLKLAEIYRILQKDSAVSATYSQLVEAYVNQGQLDQAVSVLETLISREPSNGQHKTKLEFLRGKLAGGKSSAPATPAAPARPPAPVAAPPDIIDEEFDISAPLDEPSFAPPAAPSAPVSAPPRPAAPVAAGLVAPARPSIEVTGPLSEEDKEFVEEHLAEGKVFRKYGLVDKAADQFESVVARFPDNAEARQELREVYKEKGLNAKAAEQSLALAEILRMRGDPAAAAQHEAEAYRLAPELTPSAAGAAEPEPEPVAEAVLETEVAFETEADVDLGMAEAEQEISIGVEEEEEEVSLSESEELAVPVEEATETFDLGTDTALLAEDEIPSFPPEPAAEEPGLELETEEEELSLSPEAPEAEDVSFIPPNDEEDVQLEMQAEAPEPLSPAEDEWSPSAEVAAEPSLDLSMDTEPETPSFDSPLDDLSTEPAFDEPASEPELELPPPAPAAPTVPVPLELQRALDEVDSYISLGFVDDARDALRDANAHHPGHPAIVGKLDELGMSVQDLAPAEEPASLVGEPSLGDDLGLGNASAEDDLLGSALGESSGDMMDELSLGGMETPAGETALAQEAPAPAWAAATPAATPPGFEDDFDLGAPPPVAEPPAAEDSGMVDLGAELGGLFDAQTAVEESPAAGTGTDLGDSGLAEIFKEFKKGVDKQLGKEDYDTRYNLGIAYKEMGLVDEAIAEFQLAAKDEARLLECSSMLGICFLEKGMPKLAVKWFEKGLKAPGRNEEEYNGIRYDLGMAHEAAGEMDKALQIFTDLYGLDANFRDVAAKVRELRSAP